MVLALAAALFFLFGGDNPQTTTTAGAPPPVAPAPDAAAGDTPPREQDVAGGNQPEGAQPKPPVREWGPGDPRRNPPIEMPAPPPIAQRPPHEGEEGETIPPSARVTDLTGQAMQAHRDLDLTLRVLQDLMR